MSDLVSIITPTWNRRELLEELLWNILAQTHRPLEHVIVSDGPDPELLDMIDRIYGGEKDISFKFAECGRNWSTFLPDSYTAIPLMTATHLASADYHMWMADDERMLVPDHIEKLLALLKSSESDFVYSKVLMFLDFDSENYGMWNKAPFIIGKSTPEYGQITHCLYRVEALKHGMYRPFVGSEGDWDVVQRWMQAGLKWAFLSELTLSHVANK